LKNGKSLIHSKRSGESTKSKDEDSSGTSMDCIGGTTDKEATFTSIFSDQQK